MLAPKPLRDQITEIVRDKIDAATLRLLELAFDDAARIAVIRDAFLEGRDLEAVGLLRELDHVGLRKVLPFGDQTLIYPTGSALIRAYPQLPFTATAVAIPSSVARNFMINDVRIGSRSQFVQAGDVPAELAAVDLPIFEEATLDENGFLTIRIDKRAERHVGLPIDMPECQPGQELIIIVTNIGQETLPLRGAYLGTVPGH